MTAQQGRWTRAARVADVERAGCLTVQVDGHTVALFAHQGRIYAVDNRCPHMGFPLDRGTVQDGILTCHWHHARFDLASGGTFDLFADDVPAFPADVRDGDVWLDLTPRGDATARQKRRLLEGLQQTIPLVIGKAVIHLLDDGGAGSGAGGDAGEAFRVGLDFGVRQRAGGWAQGLTILTCMVNLLPALDREDRPRALYHGLSAVANDCAGEPPRHAVHPLPDSAESRDLGTLKRWFRRFVEMRDGEGAERCIVTALQHGADARQMADMLFAAATDHRYIDGGHTLDFTNKALEALDTAGWSYAAGALGSLANTYANASRREESSAWRTPVDLVELLHAAFAQLPAALDAGQAQRGTWQGADALAQTVLGDDPQAVADALLAALRDGATEDELAGSVSYAGALRIAHFHTSNEFTDWDSALHSFTFANAVQQGLRRAPSVELLRGVFDAAMSIYLDRFLNIPAAPLPQPDGRVDDPAALLRDLLPLLDRQQQVNEAGRLVARYLYGGGDAAPLQAALGKALLREDRNFHTIQMVEAAFRQHATLRGTAAGVHVLVAAARYLGAHAPTMRAQGQTFQIAQRLHRGERLFEE